MMAGVFVKEDLMLTVCLGSSQTEYLMVPVGRL